KSRSERGRERGRGSDRAKKERNERERERERARGRDRASREKTKATQPQQAGFQAAFFFFPKLPVLSRRWCRRAGRGGWDMEAAQPTCALPAGRDGARRAQFKTNEEPSTWTAASGEAAASSAPATPGENQTPRSLQAVQLEVKVVELERKIFELERAVQDERKVHSLQFSAKTSMIDALRIKVNRLEFAIKEAIIFLSKPLEKMQSVMTSGIQKGAGGRATGGGDAKKQENAVKTKKAGDARQASQQQQQQQQQQPSQPASLFSPLESECLECMRFSIQYLEKAQAATSHISPAGHAKPGVALAAFPERRASEDESM
ncbi:MAG: hypothetical protein BJ554DRAFT_5895, partial [Olpidium bornovanus]